MPDDPGSARRLPGGAVRPDYGCGGLYGLAAGVRRWLAGERAGLPWMASDEPQQAGGGVLVFWLVDGLGDDFLQRFGAGSALLAHRRGRLTSVFPSTTASAITTVMTGLMPQAHGLTGWFIHDRRFGGVLAPLPIERRGGGALHGPFLIPRLFPYRSLFQRTRRPAVVVAPRPIAWSGYSLRHSRGARIVAHDGVDDLVGRVAEAVRELGRAGGGYVYAYHDRFDALSHRHGCHSAPVVEEFGRIDVAFRTLCDRLAGSGAEVLVSADHGFIDNPPERRVQLDAHPDVSAMLNAPLFGERRAAFCHVKAGAEEEFEAWAREALAGKGVVRRSAELVAEGLFGHGARHKRLAERVGTHALLMEAGWTVSDHVPGERHHELIGVHGGLSAEEMWIPLIRARCA
ncbi:alkaline phosphatase family protein [Pseudothauera rhizosphaerae]|uniref:Alkaline phosphatase family protein n=2 Tax=Pseudothauera rhizosphaerae TaxID=2565932 RepID=A0A4S4AUG7_9RHOO|nr:alkaline phosphatase family protein [Pseudothauera rhizosphaerae]